ncbi:hypothetical protein, partial [Vibrio cholerae]|uniref:hypothetical protein n=1 Tax=Vibrio cholerae TaxID=666 RepID=UPI0019646078
WNLPPRCITGVDSTTLQGFSVSFPPSSNFTFLQPRKSRLSRRPFIASKGVYHLESIVHRKH